MKGEMRRGKGGRKRRGKGGKKPALPTKIVPSLLHFTKNVTMSFLYVPQSKTSLVPYAPTSLTDRHNNSNPIYIVISFEPAGK